jgi:DNA (cytosine-5)-methyltransferase 1
VTAYYNEHDPFAAAWLRQLIKARAIAPGEVDERDIRDVTPDELSGYTQCHFFAGIGVWSYALRLAGWPDERPVWTGSCPCQPFSSAGRGGGFDDERHLWPAWFHLIEQCRPRRIFGEQVASKDGLAWLDLVLSDLEAADYTATAVDLCAAGIGAPHIRQRLWIVGADGRMADPVLAGWAERRPEPGPGPTASSSSSTRRVADDDDDDAGCREQWGARLLDSERQAQRNDAHGCGATLGVADSSSTGLEIVGQQLTRRECAPLERSGEAGRLGDASLDGAGEHSRQLSGDEVEHAQRAALRYHAPFAAGATRGHWAGADWIYCRDGKFRPVEPGSFPLAHGAPARVGRLRGYGNAIVAEAAAEFIRAALECGIDLI